MKEEISFLKKVSLFNSFSQEELGIVYPCLKSIRIKRNEMLFTEGDEGNKFFIVKSGSVASSIKCQDGSQREIAVFKPQDFFGEMSIFENAPRSATCYAKEESVLYEFQKSNFFSLLKAHPDFTIRIMYKMLKIITQRLRSTGNFLSDMVRWGNEASKRAVTDELTGLYNRRYLDSMLETYFQISRAGNKPMTLIMVDLDYFREINNLYGHETGDKAIIEVANTFRKHLREQDSMARYGGDEFTVILRDTDQKDALYLAEKIRIDMKEITLLKQLEGSVSTMSLSMGMASFPRNAQNLTELRHKADQALYKAKENGRDRIVCA
ncbi:MAG: GGDEF domain-containing protein [Spirochaetes bacterium]|nr:GGDEF domain-containing protein [Spirochaetota bacterium]